jgi:multidrug transporter EmrE-like cation transporter
MSIEQISMLYNAVFIIILAIVCFIFSRIHLKIAGMFTKKRWLFTSIYFIAVCFITIAVWYNTIGFVL